MQTWSVEQLYAACSPEVRCSFGISITNVVDIRQKHSSSPTESYRSLLTQLFLSCIGLEMAHLSSAVIEGEWNGAEQRQSVRERYQIKRSTRAVRSV